MVYRFWYCKAETGLAYKIWPINITLEWVWSGIIFSWLLFFLRYLTTSKISGKRTVWHGYVYTGIFLMYNLRIWNYEDTSFKHKNCHIFGCHNFKLPSFILLKLSAVFTPFLMQYPYFFLFWITVSTHTHTNTHTHIHTHTNYFSKVLFLHNSEAVMKYMQLWRLGKIGHKNKENPGYFVSKYPS